MRTNCPTSASAMRRCLAGTCSSLYVQERGQASLDLEVVATTCFGAMRCKKRSREKLQSDAVPSCLMQDDALVPSGHPELLQDLKLGTRSES